MNFGALQWETLRDLLLDREDLTVKIANEMLQSRTPRYIDNHRDPDRIQAMLREIRSSLALIQDAVWILSGEQTESQRQD